MCLSITDLIKNYMGLLHSAACSYNLLFQIVEDWPVLCPCQMAVDTIGLAS